MDNKQIDFLLQKKILKINESIVNFDYFPPNTESVLLKIDIQPTDVILECKNLETNNRYALSYKYMTTVDGMSINKIIDAYDEFEVIEIDDKTNVSRTVIGKKVAKIGDIELEDNMQFILHNEKDKKFKDKVIKVRGVGESIELVLPRGRPKTIKN